jgi:hypothetical protein
MTVISNEKLEELLQDVRKQLMSIPSEEVVIVLAQSPPYPATRIRVTVIDNGALKNDDSLCLGILKSVWAAVSGEIGDGLECSGEQQ